MPVFRSYAQTVSGSAPSVLQHSKAMCSPVRPGKMYRRVSLCIASAVLACLPLLTICAERALAAKPPATLALGAYIDDPKLGGDAPCASAVMDRYAALVGRMPAIVVMQQSWAESYNMFPTRCLAAVVRRRAIPMVSWFSGGHAANELTFKLTRIIDGNLDSYITKWATDAKAWGDPFFLRFDAEMNGNWTAWGTGPNTPNGNTPGQFIAAWRHVHRIFTQVGATNAIWVWSPNLVSKHSPDLRSVYPGDAYVDWVGLDGFNDGTDTNAGLGGWQSFDALFAQSYKSLAALTRKPMIVAETGSAELGGNKAIWITQALLDTVPNHFPRLKAVLWFDANKETDWRVNSSAATLAAFRRVAASRMYSGSVHCNRKAMSSWSCAVL